MLSKGMIVQEKAFWSNKGTCVKTQRNTGDLENLSDCGQNQGNH